MTLMACLMLMYYQQRLFTAELQQTSY